MALRLIKDESGVAMGLAVILIVIVGVMGAGLLVFVRNDLEAVVEVNQGQNALDTADAGLQAGEHQLRINARPGKYDGAPDPSDSVWSHSQGGKSVTLEGNTTNVKIKYLQPVPDSSPSLVNDPEYAPRVLPSGESEYPNDRHYFKIISRAEAGNAKRVVESIVEVSETGMPSAWYSTGDIEWKGNAFEVKNVSVFARGDVLNFRAGNLKGCDVVYEDWDRSPWNNSARDAGTRSCTDDSGNTFSGVPTGVGALGNISYKSGDGRQGSIDYDTDTAPNFEPNTWTNSGGTQDPTMEMSFPFNPDADEQVDLDVLRSMAASGQNDSKLIEKDLGTTLDLDDYPSDANTVYFVEFVDPTDGDYVDAGGSSNPGTVEYNGDTSKGTIVVVNGNFEMKGNTTFTGIILVRDPEDDGEELEFTNSGNVTLNGFANVDGDIRINGSVDSDTPLLSASAEDNITTGLSRRPGFHTVERWSWRECYSENCN